MKKFIVIQVDKDGNEAQVDEFESRSEAEIKVAKLNGINEENYYVKEVSNPRFVSLFNVGFIDD